MKISLAALNVSGAPGYLRDFIAAQGQNNARAILNAATIAAITDNSTGSNAGSGLTKLPTLTKAVPNGANLAPRAAFNTAAGKLNNAIATLAAYLQANAFAYLYTGANDPAFSGGNGTDGEGTVAALDKTLAATAGANTPAVAATQTLTGDGTNVSNGDTVTIGTKVYTFQTALTEVDGHVLIGASAAASLTNLFHAINKTGGTIGTDYATATTAHPLVVATNPSGTTVVVTAKTAGAAGNAIATTETAAHAAWGAATLANGADVVNGDALKRSEAQAAVATLENNFSTVVKGYNTVAAALGVATVADGTGGKADLGFALVNKAATPAATAVDGDNLGDVVSDTQMDDLLTKFANNIAYLANKINTVLLADATVQAVIPVVLTP